MATGFPLPALPASSESLQRTPGLSAHPEGPPVLPPAILLALPSWFSILSPVFFHRAWWLSHGARSPILPKASGEPEPVGWKIRGPGKREARGLRMCLELWVHCLEVCERPACVAGEGCPSLWPRAHPRPSPAAPFLLSFLIALLYSRTLAHTLTYFFSPALPSHPCQIWPPLPYQLSLPPLSCSLCLLSNCQPIGSGKSIPS